MYCRFHVDKAFRQGVHNKIEPSADKEQIEIEVREDFNKVRQSKTKAGADQKISWFLEKYKAHIAFIPYVKKWFALKPFVIEGYNSEYVRDEDTNNLIKSFHALLKLPKFLGKRGDRRSDVLAHQLFTFVVPSFEGKEKKVLFGFLNRVCDKAETLAQKMAADVPEEKVQEKAFLSGEGEITVRSFTDNTTEYSVNLELAGLEKNTCTCPVNSNSGSMCEHIYLAQRFWEANTYPEGTSFETWNSERSTSLYTSSSNLLRVAARANDTNVIGLASSSDEEDESFSDCFTPRADHEDSHTSISLEVQTALFMANSTTNIEEAESSSHDLLEMNFLEEEIENDDTLDWSSNILLQSSLIRPQQDFHGNSQAATQRNELENQRTIIVAKGMLVNGIRTIGKLSEKLTSAEQLYKLAKCFEEGVKRCVQDLKTPNTKQRC